MTKRLAIKLSIFAAVLMALSVVDAAARPITLAWDASPDATVAGYRVYWSTQPGTYTETDYFDVGHAQTWVGDLPGDQYYFVVRAYDAAGNLGEPSLEVGDTRTFWLTSPGDQASQTGQAVALPLVAQGATVTYGADGLPDGLSLDAVSGLIFGTITASVPFPTAQIVTARAVDAAGHVSSVQFYWTIRTNHAPIMASPGDQTTLADTAVTLPVIAQDPDDHSLLYTATNLPLGLSIDSTTGIISGTVSPAATGLFNVSVAVSDGELGADVAFTWRILSGDKLIIDRSVSAEATGSSVTTEPFSTALVDETLVAFVLAAQPTTDGVQTAIVSGGGLAWSRVAQANAQAGTAEIWWARAAAPLSDVTVTADTSIGGTFLSLTVVSFVGADGVGASAAASAPSGAPAVSLTTTRPGSFVYGAGNDWNGSVSRTIPPGQELVHEWLGEAGDTFWVQRLTGAVAADGTPVTLTDVAPTDHMWNFAAVEIRARSQAVPTIPTIVLSPAVASPGGSLSAAISGAPGNPDDWAGLFSETAGPTAFLERQFLNGGALPPAAGMTSAQLTFTAPAQPGRYNVRLFSAANPATPLAVSNTILVQASGPVSLSIDDASTAEGTGKSSSMTFTVTLSAPSQVAVSVNYATADGTAKAGSDYTPRKGVLVFRPGTVKQTIAVPIRTDKKTEVAESFTLLLSGATGAVIVDPLALGTIINDDSVLRIFGFGAIVDGRLHNRFVFRSAERNARDYGRLEFWSSEPINGKGLDDGHRSGFEDNDYRHNHKAAKNRFEATVVNSVTFGPAAKNGRLVTFSGSGQWNGKPGYTFEAQAMDRAEPGRRRDTFALIVKNGRGAIVLKIGDTINEGNVQLVPPSSKR